jgi:glutaredoxin
MSAPLFTLYSRPGCHLCDDMKATVNPIATRMAATLEEVDISTSADLEARFGTEIPVLFVNGRKAFKYRVSATDLQRYLRRLG